jgi:hypothetical protein
MASAGLSLLPSYDPLGVKLPNLLEQFFSNQRKHLEAEKTLEQFPRQKNPSLRHLNEC